MKAKFLPLLLLAILLQVSMFSFANEMTSAQGHQSVSRKGADGYSYHHN